MQPRNIRYGPPVLGPGYPYPYFQPQQSPYPYPVQAAWPEMPPSPGPATFGGPAPYGGYPQQAIPYSPPAQQQKMLFQNPLQPGPEHPFGMKYQPGPQAGLYPKPGAVKPPAKSVLQSFKSQDGSLDLSKMVNTAGQMVNTLNQVAGMAKGLTGIFKV